MIPKYLYLELKSEADDFIRIEVYGHLTKPNVSNVVVVHNGSTLLRLEEVPSGNIEVWEEGKDGSPIRSA